MQTDPADYRAISGRISDIREILHKMENFSLNKPPRDLEIAQISGALDILQRNLSHNFIYNDAQIYPDNK